MRTVILLGTPFFVSELRSLLATSSSVEVKDYDWASTVDGALYVYFGESKKDKARKYENISLENFIEKVSDWQKDHFLGDCPIDAQYALDLIFKTLVDDREDYPYLTIMSESTEQTNSIMLDLILRKYSRKYRKYLKSKRKMANK